MNYIKITVEHGKSRYLEQELRLSMDFRIMWENEYTEGWRFECVHGGKRLAWQQEVPKEGSNDRKEWLKEQLRCELIANIIKENFAIVPLTNENPLL